MSPVKIRQANEWLIRLRDEAAGPSDRAAFETWLQADPRNREAFEHTAGAIADIGGLGGELRAYIEARPRQAYHRRTFVAAAMAAAALIVVGLGFNLLAPSSYATAIGQQRAIQLSDGSRVELNTNTRIIVRYTDAVRHITLDRGEAVFAVVHNPSRPFIVEADGQSVRAVGTQFAVRMEAHAVSVTVIEGIVAVDTPQTSTAPARPLIAAGQRLDLSADSAGLETVANADIQRHLAWRTGWLEFNGQPLALAASEVARYTSIRFVIEDPELQQLKVWAYFRAADVEGFLSSLEQNAPSLAVTRENGEIHIARRQLAAD